MSLPEPVYQNSAGRLLAILKVLPAGGDFLQGIPRLFEINTKDPYEQRQACMTGLGEIHKLYHVFRRDLLEAAISDQQRNVLLSGLAELPQTIYPMQLNAGIRPATEAEKSLLEVCATILPQEPALEKDDVGKIGEAITSLRALVERGDVPPSLRAVLLELIRMTEDAIAKYNIRGARGLRKAFKTMLAEVTEAYAIANGDGERNNLRQSEAWLAIHRLLSILDATASRLLKYQPLLQWGAQLLLGGPNP